MQAQRIQITGDLKKAQNRIIQWQRHRSENNTTAIRFMQTTN
jgi:hypothetical protein